MQTVAFIAVKFSNKRSAPIFNNNNIGLWSTPDIYSEFDLTKSNNSLT